MTRPNEMYNRWLKVKYGILNIRIRVFHIYDNYIYFFVCSCSLRTRPRAAVAFLSSVWVTVWRCERRWEWRATWSRGGPWNPSPISRAERASSLTLWWTARIASRWTRTRMHRITIMKDFFLIIANDIVNENLSFFVAYQDIPMRSAPLKMTDRLVWDWCVCIYYHVYVFVCINVLSH